MLPTLNVVSRNTHTGQGGKDIVVNVDGRVENSDVTSESRNSGITELRVTFPNAPNNPASSPVTLRQQTCASCPCTGTQAAYETYSGDNSVTWSVTGNTLVLGLTDAGGAGLENARTYKLTLSSALLGCQAVGPNDVSFELRGLKADCSSDGKVDGVDRSVVVGVWTGGPPQFTPATDINQDGITDATDRSIVVGVWTGSENCAP